MELSVVILTWNSSRYVRRCVDSVIHALDSYNYEVIVVDNGSSDDTLQLLNDYANKRIKVIKQMQNLGVAKARNIGINNSTGDLIWILDVDTEVNPNAIKSMISFVRGNSECGLCGCRLTDENGCVQDSCRKYPRLRYKLMNFIHAIAVKSQNKKIIERIDRCNAGQFYREKLKQQEPFKVEYVIGACQLFNRSILDKVGMLDEKIFYGPEDADFCKRINESGHGVFYMPNVTITHYYQRITNKKLFSPMSVKHARALVYFWWKHRML